MVNRSSVPAPFLTKTYDLVDDRSTDEVISWNEIGTAFVVWRTAEFAGDLLPNYFKHNNFASFVRQLNTYGFRKTVSDKWEFANENFKRGEKGLLALIRRRKIASPVCTTTGNPTTTGSYNNPPDISGEELGSSSGISSQNSDLSDENEKLRKDNRRLRLNLSRIEKQRDELIDYLTKYMNVAPGEISRIISGGGGEDYSVSSDSDEDENAEDEMKLFGVILQKKRSRITNIDFFRAKRKEIKTSI